VIRRELVEVCLRVDFRRPLSRRHRRASDRWKSLRKNALGRYATAGSLFLRVRPDASRSILPERCHRKEPETEGDREAKPAGREAAVRSAYTLAAGASAPAHRFIVLSSSRPQALR
jgi:hypothetical protein